MTNASGTYTFTNLLPGDYQLDFIPPGSYGLVSQDVGADDTIDSDPDWTGMTAITTLIAGETDNTWDAGTYDWFGLNGESSDSGGTGKVLYMTNESVYAIGSGFAPTFPVDVIVVPGRVWNDGDQIPPDITDSGTTTVIPDASGNILPAAVWAPPLMVGTYNIVFDINQDGQYIYPSGWEGPPEPIGFFEVREPSQYSGGPTVGGQVMLPNKFELITQYLSLPMRLIMGFAF